MLIPYFKLAIYTKLTFKIMQIDQLSLTSISKEPCTDPYKSKKLYTYFTLFNVYNSTNICTHTYIHTNIYTPRSLARSPLASS